MGLVGMILYVWVFHIVVFTKLGVSGELGFMTQLQPRLLLATLGCLLFFAALLTIYRFRLLAFMLAIVLVGSLVGLVALLKPGGWYP